MYRAIIADDEIHILRLVKRFVESEHVAVTGEASDGMSAYRMTLEQKPDILITDIRMPGYDGIEMIRRLREDMPELNIIIISGYRDFSYAQEAIRYGAIEYLLKPIDEDELAAALRKAEKRIEDSRQTMKTLSETSKALESTRLADFLFDEHGGPEGGGPGRMPDFLSGGGQFYFAMILKIDNGDMLSSFENQRQEMCESLTQKIAAILSKNGWSQRHFYRNNRVYIIGAAERDEPLSGSAIKELRTLLRAESYKYGFLKFSASAGQVLRGAEGLKRSLAEAERGLFTRFYQPGESLFGPWNAPLSPAKDGSCSLSHERNLKRVTESMDAEKLPLAFEALRRDVQSRVLDAEGLYTLALRLVRELSAEAPYSSDGDVPGTPPKAVLDRLDNCTSTEALLAVLENFVSEKITAMKDYQERKMSRPIHLAQEYIHRNTDRPITLEEVAGEVHVNPNYLSSLFKQKTGVGFSDYVTSVKLEKAKELLRSSFLSVGEIAAAVGYSDSKRFSKMFIRNMGIRPTEYRKFYS